MDDIQNPWLQHLKTKIMGYIFIASWLKGTLNAPDTLSHNPTADPQPEEVLAEREIDRITAISAAEVRAITSTEEPIRIIKSPTTIPNTRSSNPTSHQDSPNTKKSYTPIVDNIGMPTHSSHCRLLIPVQMRREALAQLHDSHQGTVRTKDRARLTVYWPGMDKGMDTTILSCKLMSRFSAIATKGAHYPQTHAPEDISRNCSRLLLTCNTS